MAGRRDPWVRWFDVTSPKKHSGGFTIYKVTSKVSLTVLQLNFQADFLRIQNSLTYYFVTEVDENH